MNEIQDANPQTRRLAMLLVFCGIFAGVAGLWLVESRGPAVEAWLTRDPEQMRSRFSLFFGVLAVVVALPVFGLAGYFWRLGARIIRTDRFPPPGFPVIRDTVVLLGAPAYRWGRLVQGVAIILIAAMCAFALLLWQLLSLLESRADAHRY